MVVRSMLAASVVLLGLSSDAFAGHLGGGKGHGGGKTKPLVVRDVNGALVGTYMGAEIINGVKIVNVAYRGDPLDSTFFDSSPLVALAVKVGNIVTRRFVFFAGASCGGAAYIDPGISGSQLEGFLDVPKLDVVEDPDPVLYVPANPNLPLEDPVIETVFSTVDGCGDEGGTYPRVVSGVTLAEDVILGFSSPYTLTE